MMVIRNIKRRAYIYEKYKYAWEEFKFKRRLWKSCSPLHAGGRGHVQLCLLLGQVESSFRIWAPGSRQVEEAPTRRTLLHWLDFMAMLFKFKLSSLHYVNVSEQPKPETQLLWSPARLLPWAPAACCSSPGGRYKRTWFLVPFIALTGVAFFKNYRFVATQHWKLRLCHFPNRICPFDVLYSSR